MSRRTFLLLAAGVILLAAFALPRQPDAGAFRLNYETSRIEPADHALLRSVIRRKPILLTFDDAPQDVATDRAILDTLAKHEARALWFVNCKWIDPAMDPDAAANADMLRAIVAEGHLIGNHGYEHLALGELDAAGLQHEIAGCSDAIAAVTGERPSYYRPSWGTSSPEADAVIAANGMRNLLWSENSYDTLLDTFKADPAAYAQYLTAHPMQDVGNSGEAGDVILFHDYPHTALVLDRMLTELESRGFQFVVPD